MGIAVFFSYPVVIYLLFFLIAMIVNKYKLKVITIHTIIAFLELTLFTLIWLSCFIKKGTLDYLVQGSILDLINYSNYSSPHSFLKKIINIFLYFFIP